jgi:chromosome segregation ATPase
VCSASLAAAKARGQSVAAFKHASDTRYHATHLATHDGKQIAAMEQQQATLDAALKEKQIALAQAQATLAAAQAAVTRWQGEIQFVSSLKQLMAERKSAELLVGERLAAQQTIEQELAAVQQRLDAAKAAVGEASTGQETVEQRIRELKGIQ